LVPVTVNGNPNCSYSGDGGGAISATLYGAIAENDGAPPINAPAVILMNQIDFTAEYRTCPRKPMPDPQ
jgi:hypothetical protein